MQLDVMWCKKRIATLWLFGSAFIFLIFLFQTFFGHFSESADEAWSWFLPSVLPTLSLIIGALVADALGQNMAEKKVDSYIFKVSFYLSIFYFIVIFLTIVLQPIVTYSVITFYKKSNLWLVPIQGLVTASLGAFFVKMEKSK